MTSSLFQTHKGQPSPFGTTITSGGINFALFCKHATAIKLLLYDLEKDQKIAEIALNPQYNRTGDVWHIFVEHTLEKPLGYAYQLDGPIEHPESHRYKFPERMVDPYAKAIHSNNVWGKNDIYTPLGIVMPEASYDWENDAPLRISKSDLIIYEMHVRSFTIDPSSQVRAPGTFQGVIEKIPHLVDLGINAVELMPLQEFNECEYKVCSVLSKERLYQYWGYSTVNYFAPMNRYVSTSSPGNGISEFKDMVKALHKNNIAVILDIVFNHTSEGDDETGSIHSFKGIDNCVYYMMDEKGVYLNFTGCGNTFNTNHPVVIQFVIDVLRYWVLEMHVDGFRFDLSSIFYRDENGHVLSKPPVLEMISQDPLLANTLLIAEPWDAAGLYQVGNFYSKKSRWSEWNARYRDAVRCFIKGTPNLNGKFASRISGSQDIYGSQLPLSSINFIVAHDGFTLHDLVSYNEKHNFTNGENNRDGLNNNDSWNCGVEGNTKDEKILTLRQRQMRNFHLALMISQGIPMLLMGDEYGHTKMGNNNTWCHDNQLNWFLWNQLKENEKFYNYYRFLIEFRKKTPLLKRKSFLTDRDIAWWSPDAQNRRWDEDTQFLAFTLFDHENQQDLYCAFNAQNNDLKVTLPKLDNRQWSIVVDNCNLSLQTFYKTTEEPCIENAVIEMPPFSSLLFKSKKLS